MSTIELRVELPAYSYSFQIEVETAWSIQAVKEEIKRACPGSPQVDGQRVIWRGRFLRDDELVKDIWKTEDDARIIHLSIHPSAWTSSPPVSSIQSRTSRAVPLPPAYANSPNLGRRDSRAQFVPPPVVTGPIPYIVQKHANAIHVLTHGSLPPTQPETVETAQLRIAALHAVQAYGWSWPSVLDEEYPAPSTISEGGVKYEQVTLENQQYLKLANPGATPTPIQRHALKVLTYTFSLLSVPYPDPLMYPPIPSYTMPYPYTPTANLNQHLQQLGLPPLRLAPLQQPNQNPNDPNNAIVAEIRVIPIRALLMPLVMLTIRTFILMYFFSPSKRPVFGILLSLWILYETWGALRAVIGNERQGGAAGARAEAGGADGGNNAARQAAGAGQVQGAEGVNQPARRHSDFLLDFLANMNLHTEDDILNADAPTPAPEPSLFHRARSFVGLFVMSLHPAMWDRRRTALRRREGRLKTEATIMETAPPEPAEGEEVSAQAASRAQARAQLVARHERRPAWVRSYVERVQNTDWLDDA